MRLVDADELMIKFKIAQKAADQHGREFADCFYDAGGEISTNWYCVEDMVDNTPTVDAVPVAHGYWKAVTDDGKDYKRICSCCGEEAPFDESEDIYLIYPHCPWCGARNGVRGQ